MNHFVHLPYSGFYKADIHATLWSCHTYLSASHGRTLDSTPWILSASWCFPWWKLFITLFSQSLPERHGLEKQTCDFAQSEGPDGPELNLCGEVITESEVLIYLQEKRKQRGISRGPHVQHMKHSHMKQLWKHTQGRALSGTFSLERWEMSH